MQETFDSRILVWTGAAVLVTGIVSGYFLLQPPRSLIAEAHASTELTTHADREPAATRDTLAATNASIVNPKHAAIDYELPCDGNKAFEHNVAQVRLIGTPCGAGKLEFSKSEIRNEANGFSATVFHPTAKTFTTDYISLSPGANAIKIHHWFKSGRNEERTFVIERAR